MTLIDTTTFLDQKLTPVMYPEKARVEPVRFGINLTIRRGQAIAIKTADKLAYAFAAGGSDGTELFKGFSMYALKTDAAGRVYYADTAANTWVETGRQMSPIYECGWFDPLEVSTAATLTANVVTLTAASTIEVGDLFTVTYTYPNTTTRSITISSTGTTATTVAAQVIAAWNADAQLALLATATGTATVVLTQTTATAGNDLHGALTLVTTEADGSTSDAQTWAKVNTTPAAGRSLSVLQTARAGCYAEAHGYWVVPG